MLHYGYFEDIHVEPASISIQQLEEAQVRYAQNIIEYIEDKERPILDVGCGMGGLAEMIYSINKKVECLTPNRNQIDFITEHAPHLKTHHFKFEDFSTDQRYGTIINSESLQYIPLESAFQQMESLLLPGGRWIIVDYFRHDESGINTSAHLLEQFYSQVRQYKWEIIEEKDITAHVLPTIAYAHMYVERFLMPIKHFAYEKLRFKKAWLYYMTKGIRGSIEKKISKEVASIDPNQFLKEKKYMFFVLEKA
jgi:MPBQ/MSBQ methyltransferase